MTSDPMTRLFYLIIVSLTVASLIACGDDDNGENNQEPVNNDDPPEMTALEEACLHAREDHPLDREATADREDASANIAEGHTHFRITLPESTIEPDLYEGYAVYDVDAADTYGLFASSGTPVLFLDSEGEMISSETETVDECPEITTQHTVELDAGSHYIRLGPSHESELSTVTERLPEFE